MDEDIKAEIESSPYYLGNTYEDEYLAGYTAFKKFKFAPQISDALDWAEAAEKTMYGKIRSLWKKEDGKIHEEDWGLRVVVGSGSYRFCVVSCGA